MGRGQVLLVVKRKVQYILGMIGLEWATALMVAAYAPLEGVQWSCGQGAGTGRVDVVVGAGALHERDDERGVAHLLEHLLFRKSNFTYRHENGHTALDLTYYYRTSPSDSLPAAIESLLRELMEPTFNANAVDVERKVVIKELEERGLDKATGPDPLFGSTPLSRSPGGTARDVRGLELQDVLRFHRTHYGKGNVAIRVSGAADCTAIEAQILPLLREWPTGSAAPTPKVTESEPGQVTLPSNKFRQGFYWYEASPEERLLWVALGEHLRLRAFRELRQERGLIYTPEVTVQRVGPGGLLSFTVDAGDNPRAVSRWFDDTIAALKTEPQVTVHLAEALTQVERWLNEHPETAGLAAIRAEPAPARVLAKLKRDVPQPLLKQMLVDRRRFGSEIAQSNIASLIVLSVFGIGVLGILFYAGRQFLES